MNTAHLRCPRCLSELRGQESEYVCPACEERFPAVWGIPILTSNRDYYFAPTPRAWLNQELEKYRVGLLDGSKNLEEFFREIIANVPESRRKEWTENLIDEGRAAPKYLFPLSSGSHVLNLGSGWDNTTINLARTADHVTAIDLTQERVQMLDLKRRHYGMENVTLVCGGDTAHLPFASGTFDAVFINGVLEWVATTNFFRKVQPAKSKPATLLRYLRAVYTHHQPEKVQTDFLEEVRRILKPDGEVYVGIENRYARDYFGRRKDHHSFIWFGSLYPRFVAHLVSLYLSRKPYLTFTHSRRGYRKLLSRAGFPTVHVYAVEPDYRLPRHLIDLDDSGHLEHYTKNFRIESRTLPKGLYAFTVPSFGIIGFAGREKPNWPALAVEDFTHRMGWIDKKCELRAVRFTGKSKLLLEVDVGASRGVVFKVPMTPAVESSCRANQQALEAVPVLAKKHPSMQPFARLLPAPVYEGSLGKQPYYVESTRPGRPWSSVRDRGQDRERCAEMGRLLIGLAQAEMDFSREQEVDAIRARCETLRSVCQEYGREDARLDRLAERMYEIMDRHPRSASLRKGDLTLSNILVEKSAISGIVDFDEWRMTSCALSNLAEFTFSYLRTRHGVGMADAAEMLLRESWQTVAPELPVTQVMENLGLNREDLELGVLSFWLDDAQYVVLDEKARYDTIRVRYTILDVLDRLAAWVEV